MEEKLEDFLKGKNIKVKLIKLDEFKGNNFKLINFKKNNPDTMLIFEDLWKNKTDIIKSIISVKLDSKIKKYYARKLTIKEVPQQLSKKFLDENHLQGNCKSSIKLGLYDNEELIQIMTFGKARFSKSASYELIRLATKKYSVVVGGTQRLFNYFIKKYNNPSIVSYDDEMIFTGSIYEKLGFKLKSNKVRGYSYYNDTDKVRIGRTYFQKSKLTSVLRSVDMTLSEEENCENNGWHKIYDCGQATWLYNPLSLRDKVKINIEDKWNLEWLNPDKKINKSFDYSFKCKKCGFVFKQKIRFDRNLSCPNCHPKEKSINIFKKEYSLKDRKYNYHVKHIKCLETGEVFGSLNELKRIGVKTIFDCLDGKQKKAHGLRWEYTEDDVTDNKKTMDLINKKEKIVCVETKEEYSSIKEAVDKTNILGIEAVINGRRKTAGKYHWIKK